MLLQLRDMKPEIACPGSWGFFGGSILENEKSEQAGIRELFEEIGYQARELHYLSKTTIPSAPDALITNYCCRLDVSLENLALREGLDWHLATFEEILAKRIYSVRLEHYFPVANLDFVSDTAQRALQFFKQQTRS